MPQQYLSPIEDIIADAKAGKMFILVDDEDRENEGDIVIPAQNASTEAINFMIKHARGLVCLALSRERVEQLKLPLMSSHNQTRHQTAFTVSIEAREGVSTGISAADRARTISVAIDPSRNSHDIITPGHVFPLIARDGGVLVRAGHTEAAVDISRMAGLNPSGVICEIIKDDGSMARLPDLVEFARQHDLKIATIADLIAYRRRTETLVERVMEENIHTAYGDFTLIIYKNRLLGTEHLALVKGAPKSPALVRMHRLNLLSDLLGATEGKQGSQLAKSLQKIEANGSGVAVIISGDQNTLSSELKKRQEAASGASDLRDYGIGAQILLDLGIREMVLLSNTERSVVGLEGYGLIIKGRNPID